MNDDLEHAEDGLSAVVRPPDPIPTHIVLMEDHATRLAGTVLVADADLLSALDIEHVRYRAANERELALGGF